LVLDSSGYCRRVNSPLIESLRRAVAAAPDDVALRLHLGDQLLAAGNESEAIAEIAAALQRDPANVAGRELMNRALAPTKPTIPAGTEPEPGSPVGPVSTVNPVSTDGEPSASQRAAATDRGTGGDRGTGNTGGGDVFDWSAAEEQVEDLAAPRFVDDAAAPDPAVSAYTTEAPTFTLADVAGMEQVKERLQAAFLAPLRNPELRKLFAKSLRGGLLLYGPPGCGKTFIARAVAGELGAKFLPIGLTDILDPYMGNSERNMHEAFQLARRDAPCVLFLDEVDAIGIRRSLTRNSGMRSTVNQLLTELDGVDGANDGVFVLAATNQPWDVDPALRRPGRFDRTLLVLPPDLAAREAIFRLHLRERPVEGIDLARLARETDGFSGADIAYICELAAEQALLDGVRTGQARLMNMADLQAGLRQARPSIGAWLDSARNVVLFGDSDGTYEELRTYLKRVKRL
jgi:AAA+ superfamily predicted ATPase